MVYREGIRLIPDDGVSDNFLSNSLLDHLRNRLKDRQRSSVIALSLRATHHLATILDNPIHIAPVLSHHTSQVRPARRGPFDIEPFDIPGDRPEPVVDLFPHSDDVTISGDSILITKPELDWCAENLQHNQVL